MAIVQRVLARVFVDDMDQALLTYLKLSGDVTPRRFRFGEIDLAWVGSFLLLNVPADRRADYERVATLLVDDIDEASAAVRSTGGAVVEGPSSAPNGPRMIARHNDGSVFEYIQPNR